MLLKEQQHALHIKRWARRKSMLLCWQAITEQIEKMFKDLCQRPQKTLWEEGKEQQKHQLNPEPPKMKGITMQFKRKSGKVNNPPRMEVLPRLALLLPQSAAHKHRTQEGHRPSAKNMAVFGDELKKLPASERAGCTKKRVDAGGIHPEQA